MEGYWGHCPGGERFSANRQGGSCEQSLGRLSVRRYIGHLSGDHSMEDFAMRDADDNLSLEEIRLVLASIAETIDALEDWEFPARTGFTRSDFDVLRRRLDRMHKQG